MFVKICGLTNLDDTLAAAEDGAQAAGFNFYPGSPRYISPEALSEWIGRVPAGMWKVGVFANETPARVREIARNLGLDIVQLHGNETAAEVPPGLRTWKAFRIQPAFDPALMDSFNVEAFLLDGPASGTTFDWSVAGSAGGKERKIVLAGGLDAENVRDAAERVRPWGLDVCSRIEISPGIKDRAKMRKFIGAALTC